MVIDEKNMSDVFRMERFLVSCCGDLGDLPCVERIFLDFPIKLH
jgi:hypothetical protein